ncbi:MAG: YihY family inner membrane protein, partial [Caldimonas sp.]
REDRLALTAGGLTFATLISLVPLVTVMLALFSAFPMFANVQEGLQRYFLETLVPETIARPVLGAVTQFSSRASRLGVVGLVALGFSALAMMLTIDRALNAIWRVRKPRPIAQRVLVYWAAATLGPLLVGVSLAGTSYAVSASAGYVGGMPRGFGFVIAVAEFAAESCGLAALFHYVPNTHVRWRHAALGAVFVATGLACGKRLLALYFGTVPTYSLIYGAFATLPIFLVWIYLGWIIVLLGAMIAAYSPVLGRRLTRWTDVPGWQFHLALDLLGRLQQARAADGSGLSSVQIAADLRTDPLQIDPLLDVLVALDWIGRLDEVEPARYVLLCDPERTPAEPLVARLLLDPTPDLAAMWQRAGFGTMTLGEIVPA